MQLKQALEAAVKELEANGVGSPRMNAEVLLMFTLSCDRAYLYAHSRRDLTADELDRYQQAVAERARGVPSQYIAGHQEFWGLDFLVSPAVLIPRPETEHLVEAVLELVKKHEIERPRIVDVGTGSGCIALALANELPGAEIDAVDVSCAALEIARANAARLQLSTRVRFGQSDLLSAFKGVPVFDFVVSNPPYVGECEADKVQREVRKFEPRVAVFGGPEGLDIVRRLVPQAYGRLKPGGWLLMEIGFSQEQAVLALLKNWREVQTIPDLQGIPRVVVARK
ncbi:MAG: peptide chain release factor N(5)-glutamine methyltransferase [Terriglobales bacterium]